MEGTCCFLRRCAHEKKKTFSRILSRGDGNNNSKRQKKLTATGCNETIKKTMSSSLWMFSSVNKQFFFRLDCCLKIPVRAALASCGKMESCKKKIPEKCSCDF